MMPRKTLFASIAVALYRRSGALLLALILAGHAALGCTSYLPRFSRSDEPQPAPVEKQPEFPLVGDLARAFGTNTVTIEGIALVTQLAGTGSDPPPNQQRGLLLSEMAGRGVRNPALILADPSTSLVLVKADLPPGVKKGDRIDVEVAIPRRSDTTSLRGGYLMQSRLKELAFLGGEVHDGHVLALAEGPILIDSLVSGASDVRDTRGRVLGGAVALQSRDLGMFIRESHQSARTSSILGNAINQRFHHYDRGAKKGVATPKRDNFIELQIHPRYRRNVTRFIAVVERIPVSHNSQQQVAYLEKLRAEMADEATVREAAVCLEALDKEGIIPLKEALESPSFYVKFFAAEALAYLGDASGTGVLAAAARDEPALRHFAFQAMTVLDDQHSQDALYELLHANSAETRYGAFNALQMLETGDVSIRGEALGAAGRLHVVGSQGEPLVHFTRARKPEIVLFGAEQRLECPFTAFAGPIMIKGDESGHVRVSRFSARGDDSRIECSNRLDDVLRAIAALGGSYPDMVQAVHDAKTQQVLKARIAFDALPNLGRRLRRTSSLWNKARVGTGVAEDEASAEESDSLYPNDPNLDLDYNGEGGAADEAPEFQLDEAGELPLPPNFEQNPEPSAEEARPVSTPYANADDWQGLHGAHRYRQSEMNAEPMRGPAEESDAADRNTEVESLFDPLPQPLR